VVVHLADQDKIFKGQPVTLTLPLQRYVVPVQDIHDKDLNLGETSANGKGTITFTLSALPTTVSLHCGWMNKMSKGALGMGFGADYKARYFILTRERLAYYADSHSIEHTPKGILECDAVTSISMVADGKTGSSHMNIVAGKEHWDLKFMDEPGRSLDAVQEVWLRKLHYCCRNAPKSTPQIGSLKSTTSPSPTKQSKRTMFGDK